MSNVNRIRWGCRGVLALGIVASIVANVLHARDDMISRSISAWPPVALLLTVELISRVPVRSPWLSGARVAATATIAGIAAWVSYWHMVAVASRYGESPDAAHMIPLSVDGLIVVASVCLVELSTSRQQDPLSEPVPAEPAEPADDTADEDADAPTPPPARPRARRTPRAAIAPTVRAAVRERPDVTVPELVDATGGSAQYVRRLVTAELNGR